MIEWGKVQTNVVSAILVGLVGSAIGILWNGATTVDQKVDTAIAGVSQTQQALKEQTEYLKQAVEIMQEELADAKRRDRDIIAELDKLEPKSKNELLTLIKPDEPEDRFIQKRLPTLNIQQMAPVFIPRGKDER